MGFVAEAFRRPADDSEREDLYASYDSAIADGLTHAQAMESLLRILLQSPQLLYREAIGTAGQDTERILGPYELAARLSYLLWDAPPDAHLLATAAAGDLANAPGIAGEARRMMDDEKFAERFQSFVWDWLELEGGRNGTRTRLGELVKDADLFPGFDANLQGAMILELDELVHEALSADDTFATLMSSRRAFASPALASHYGTSLPQHQSGIVELDPGQRAGLLTRAGVLAAYASARVQSPIQRGVMLYERILCFEFADPPPTVDDTPIDTTQTGAPLSIRGETDARTAGADCASCHGVINPAGFLFEHYDAAGIFRQTELASGHTIDATGSIRFTDIDGTYADIVEFSDAIAVSQTARECFAQQWLTAATQASFNARSCETQSILQTFAATGDVRLLLEAIVTSSAFRTVRDEGGYP
jgi:hypothetical protein